MLSGFLIGGILLNQQRSSSLKPFYARRAFRILPPYLLLLGSFFLIHVRQPGELHPVGYLLFIQNWAAPICAIPTALGITWSLAIEEQFYLFAPIAFRRLSDGGLAVLLAGVVASAALSRAAIPSGGARYCWTICRADTIALGCLVALAYQNEHFIAWAKKKAWLVYGCWTALAIASIRVLSTTPWRSLVNGYSVIAAFFALTIWIAVVQAPPKICAVLCWRPLCGLGVISYSLYLYHSGIFQLCRLAIHSAVAAAVSGLVLSIAAAYLSWRFLELPLLAYGRKRFRYDRFRAKGDPGEAIETVPDAPKQVIRI